MSKPFSEQMIYETQKVDDSEILADIQWGCGRRDKGALSSDIWLSVFHMTIEGQMRVFWLET